MPKTYAVLLSEVRNTLQIGADQGQSLTMLDDAFRYFWDYAPWKETIGALEPFWIVPGYSYYVEPFIRLPADFKDLYSAELMTVSSDGLVDWRRVNVIGNMKPGTSMGMVEAVGYSREFAGAFLLDTVPCNVVGREYISARYKKDYPYVLTAERASDEAFIFTRTEGTFKVLLGWYLRGQREQDWGQVRRALEVARQAETPGMQAETDTPEGVFRHLGF